MNSKNQKVQNNKTTCILLPLYNISIKFNEKFTH